MTMNLRIPQQPALFQGRVLGWYSHGITSAVMAKLLVNEHPDCEILNCSSTMRNEHPDNARFMENVEAWTGKKFIQLYSEKYYDIFDVFDRRNFIISPPPARMAICTIELKQMPRKMYQAPGDIHCFGMTADEPQRVERFKRDNPELYVMFPLVDAGLSKQDCLNMVMRAGIEVPAMYKLGYKNNNCIGCVKGGKGYWNKIRVDFPEHFDRMAKFEREKNARIFNDVWLDELDPTAGNYKSELEVECGVTCSVGAP